MIQAGDFKKGMTFIMDGEIYEVIEYQHVKPARGGAFLRTKIESVEHGTIKEVTLNPSDRYERAIIDNKEMQYLYNDGQFYYFMDVETYNQVPITEDLLGNSMLYIKDNDIAHVRFHEGRVIDVSPENFVELEITETEPGLKGDTASGAVKPAVVETGAKLNVPLFIDTGDVIKVDTRSGEYVSRV